MQNITTELIPAMRQSLEEALVDTAYMMAETVKRVLDHLSIKKCVLVGHSMGGYVGLAFAEKYADRLCGFVTATSRFCYPTLARLLI